MTDFTVVISHLPHVYSFDELTDLAAGLTMHIEEICHGEEQVFSDYNPEHENAGEVVSVHFGERSFGNYETLIKIERLVQQG